MLLQRFLYVPQLSFGLVLGGLFLTVAGAGKMGLHGSLGALLFGAALSGMPYQVRRDIAPGMRSVAEGLFVPLFFAAAGLHLSLSFTELPASTIAALVLVPLAGKFAGALIGALVARLDTPFALATGLMAKGVAEVALLLVLLETGVIGRDVFSLLVLIMFGYILLTPPAINAVIHRTRSSVPASAARPSAALPGALRPRRHHRRRHPRPRAHLPGPFADGARLRRPVDRAPPAGLRGRGQGRARRDRVPAHAALRAQGVVVHHQARARIVRRDPPLARPDEPVEDVLQRMTERSLTAMPVMERESGSFVGMVTSEDILDLIIADARGEH